MTHVQRDTDGLINGPDVRLPDEPEDTFVGEAHELLNEVDLLVSSRGLTEQIDREIRRIVDAALGVGFDYGVEFAREKRA